jgi:O-antigen/teichoic acid export membrane protein
LGTFASRSLFFGIMGSAAFVSLLRGFAVAAILPIADFGIYAIIVALGTFASNFLGLGKIEDTRKRFPRMFYDGHGFNVTAVADRIAGLLCIRGIVLVIFGSALSWAVGRPDLIFGIVACGLIAFSMGWSSVAISAHRSAGDYGTLSTSTLIRAILTFVFGCAGAFFGGWLYAVVGEFAGAVAGALISRWHVRRLVRNLEPPSQAIALEETRDNSGFILFLSFSICSIPFYLDRLFVSNLLGSEAAGTYGFLMLFVTGATVFQGIVEQQLGPELMKSRKDGAALSDQIAMALRWLMPFVIVVTAGMGAVGLMLFHGPGQFLVAKFALTPLLVSAVALLCALQITTTLDWILQSRDDEKGALSAALTYFLCVIVVAGFLVKDRANLATVIFGLAVAKAVHILAQSAALWRRSRVTA